MVAHVKNNPLCSRLKKKTEGIFIKINSSLDVDGTVGKYR